MKVRLVVLADITWEDINTAREKQLVANMHIVWHITACSNRPKHSLQAFWWPIAILPTGLQCWKLHLIKSAYAVGLVWQVVCDNAHACDMHMHSRLVDTSAVSVHNCFCVSCMSGVSEQLPILQQQLKALKDGQAKLSQDIAALQANSPSTSSSAAGEQSQAGQQRPASNSPTASGDTTAVSGAFAANSPNAPGTNSSEGVAVSPAAEGRAAGSSPSTDAGKFGQRLDDLSKEVSIWLHISSIKLTIATGVVKVH